MSLTETAYMSRNLIKYGGSGLVVVMIVWSVMVAGYKAYRAAHPPYVPPSTRYGVLPKVVFPEKNFDKKEFGLELQNDSFPKMSDQARVYVVYRPINTFLALEEETRAAVNMGFIGKPIEQGSGSGVYQFRNDQLNQTLTVNVLDGSFKMSYPYLTDQLLQLSATAPSRENATKIAKEYLNKSGKLATDMADGEGRVSYWRIEDGELKVANAQAEANIARVDISRKNFDNDVRIVSAEFNQAPVSVLVTGSTMEGKKVVEVNFKSAKIDRESFETYPIKTPEQAWNELKGGNYWPAVDNSVAKVVIRKMYLAYFEPVTLTNYMQPVFVFEGDNGFVAYVPAVIDRWTK